MGRTHVGLHLDPLGGKLDYDCAEGTIGPIAIRRDGSFVADGMHTPGTGGRAARARCCRLSGALHRHRARQPNDPAGTGGERRSARPVHADPRRTTANPSLPLNCLKIRSSADPEIVDPGILPPNSCAWLMCTQLASMLARSLIRAPMAISGSNRILLREIDLVVRRSWNFFAEPVWTAIPRPGRK